MDVMEAVDHAPKRRGPVLWIAVAVGVVLVALIVLLATRDPAGDRTNDSPLIGRIAPPVAGQTITTDGNYDLDLQRGQWVVVNFFATWCIPCIQEHPELIEFSRRHAELGDASVVSVVFDDDAEGVQDFFRENGGDWPVVDGGDVILDWAVAAVPESFLVDPDGRVVARLTGGVTADGLDALLEEAQGS
jgi:cytochrome c biogenesis protein CcmG/thiol:disulfide interchange protein DsbE